LGPRVIHVVVTVNCACSSGRRVGESASKSCPTHSRACACELAAKGYNLFEPSGQDGRRCQWLAAMDQYERAGCWSRGLLSIDDLENGMLSWLRQHAADEVIEAAQGDCARFGRRDAGWDHREVEGLLSRRASAWGDHDASGGRMNDVSKDESMTMTLRRVSAARMSESLHASSGCRDARCGPSPSVTPHCTKLLVICRSLARWLNDAPLSWRRCLAMQA